MFYSKRLLSKKGPLGAVWLAAYFCKKLNKAQVTQTDISTSVDKILQDEFSATTYRVLAYLLLGVVRIYSKKVEYLFDDCHEVLVQINDFAVSEKDNARRMDNLRAPHYSITLPERFELDAFDLEIVEDFSGGDVIPYEEIMLKDGSQKTEGTGNHSLDKFHSEEFADFHDTCSADHTLMENVSSSQFMDIDMEASVLQNLSNLVEKLQGDCFSREVKPVSDNHQNAGEHVEVPEMTQSGKKMQVEASMENFEDSQFSQEERVNVETFYGVEEEHLDPVKPIGEDHQTDGQLIKDPDMADPEIEVLQVVDEDHTLSNEQASIEKLQDNIFSQEECMNLEILCGAEEKRPELVRAFGEEHHSDSEQIRISEMTLSENRCQILAEDNPMSITVDATPQSKISGDLGAATPKFMLVRTPATKDRARLSRKRKCLFDDVVVFPNNIIKQHIQDSSDLVSKRKKVTTTLAAWRAHRISNLPQGFLEPSIPFISPELRSLFCKKSLKLPKKLKKSSAADKSLEQSAIAPEMTMSENLTMGSSLEQSTIAPETVMSETPTVDRSLEQTAIAQETENLTMGRSLEQNTIAPETVMSETVDRSLEQMAIAQETDLSETPTVGRSSEQTATAPETDVSETPTVGRSSEQTATAPETDVSETPTAGRSSEQMTIAPDTDVSEALTVDRSLEPKAIAPDTPVRHSASMRSFEIPESPKNSNSERVRPENSCESVEKQLSLRKDEELDLNQINEEINSCGGDTQELNGWSERTRMVAKYLDRSFLKQKKREEEALNLLQLAEGRTKKESARLFYEILVLKSKGYVDVKQDDAYVDILVWKLPQWEHLLC